MPIKFDIKLTADDMYRFNMYHAYTSLQGILSVVMGLFIIGVIVVSEQFQDFLTALPYIALACVFLLYIPVTLRFRSKRQIFASEILKGVLHYTLTTEGIVVSAGNEEEQATLPWNYVYKIVTTKSNILIYSNRVNAYIIPKQQIQGQITDIYDVFENEVESYKLKIKR